MSIPFHSSRRDVAVSESATKAGAGGIPISADDDILINISARFLVVEENHLVVNELRSFIQIPKKKKKEKCTEYIEYTKIQIS